MHCDIFIGGMDDLYIQALVQYLLKSKHNQFNITVGLTTQEIETALNKDTYGLYLIEEPMILPLVGVLSDAACSKTLVLTEPLTKINTQVLKPMLKYQKVTSIEKSMLEKIYNNQGQELVVGESAMGKIIGFYSPIGGVGTTTMAQLFAQIKSAKGYKVLFFSLEDRGGYETFFHGEHKYNLSDYMVYLLTNSNWLMGLKRMATQDLSTGIHFLKPPAHSKDIADMKDFDWQKWVKYVAEMGDYDYVVLDIGARLYKGGIELLNSCHHKVYLTATDLVAKLKWQGFVKEVKMIELDQLFENKHIVCWNRTNAKPGNDGYDLVVSNEDELYKIGPDNQPHLNPYSGLYRQVEDLVAYV